MAQPSPSQETTVAVRQVMLALLAKKLKLIAIAPPRTRGSPTFAADLCRQYAAAGMTVVHLQLDRRHDGASNGTGIGLGAARGEQPDDPVSDWWPAMDPQVPPRRMPNQGVVWLRAPANPRLQQSYNRPDVLRFALEQSFSSAQAVILELAPVLAPDLDVVCPVAAAAGCDGVVLLCPLGQSTREEVKSARDALTAAGAKIIGTVLDESQSQPPLVELAGSLEGLAWIAPKRVARVQSWLRSSAGLRN